MNDFKSYQKKYLLSSQWKGSVNVKLELASPYNFFLTRVEELPSTHNQDLTIMFPELLDQSLGTLEHSLHINFMVELPWLLAQYAVNDLINPSMTILYGVEDKNLVNFPSHLKLNTIRIKCPQAFGHHHTKMSVFFYTDRSIRFAVYTANLIESDWEDRTQGVWISPKCPYLGDGVPINYGESETLFKVEVLKYLNSYHLPEIRQWLIRIQHADCSLVRVCFVASIPGQHDEGYGHKRLSKLVNEHASNENTSWILVAQCSSIGSLGPTPDSWLLGEFSQNLCRNSSLSTQTVSVIYPSLKNVKQSIFGVLGGACLPYSSYTHMKQFWLDDYLMQWISNSRGRSRAVPHIKSYCKMSPDGTKLEWFLLTSANLSKGAWGKENKAGRLHILSYEAGVLFFPKFLIGKKTFLIDKGTDSACDKEKFPLPYDAPLTRYHDDDQVFLYDKYFPQS